MKIYISGKIGDLDRAYVERYFNCGVEYVQLWLPNFEPISPLNKESEQFNLSYKEYMMQDIDILWDCDAILMLPNWKCSKGARIEHGIAQELDKLIYYMEFDKPPFM